MASMLDDHVHSEYFDCWCGAPQHAVKVSVPNEIIPPDEPFLQLEYQLRPESFWFRLRTAYLYLFWPGLAQWNGAMFDVDGVNRLQSMIDRFKVSYKLWQIHNQKIVDQQGVKQPEVVVQ
jgi:hypothetical protein